MRASKPEKSELCKEFSQNFNREMLFSFGSPLLVVDFVAEVDSYGDSNDERQSNPDSEKNYFIDFEKYYYVDSDDSQPGKDKCRVNNQII